MKKLVVFTALLSSFGANAISKHDTQEFYEQMSQPSLCAAAAMYANNDDLSNKITNHMYSELDPYAKSEYLSNTKRGFMIGYSVGMSQAVLGQLYKQQGDPKGLDMKSFAELVLKRMCQDLDLDSQ